MTLRRVLLVLAAPLAVVVAVVVLAVVLIARGGPSRSADPAADVQPPAAQGGGSAADTNPVIDPGTPLLGTPAPGFTLTDQFGRRVTLSQFHGRAVVLAFVDSRCTTICPLTTESMIEAVNLLGPAAARRIQLLGIDANPDAITVEDVRDYSQSHQMTDSWRFLTGSRAQLAAVWRAYHVYVAASHGNIDHQPALYLIDPAGRERTLYITQMAYAGVGQQAQIIADGLSALLPGHPAPRRVVSLRYQPSVRPTEMTSLPVIADGSGSGAVRLGPGQPRVIVFVASWLSEVSDLPAELAALSRYQRQAARSGLPPVVVVDETQTEPDPGALPRLLRALPGPLGYPVVADRSGRVADGYQVQDMPWIEVVSARGRIAFRHSGWLPVRSLEAAARRAAGGAS